MQIDSPKTAVITGATSGIGKETARVLLKNGMNVVLLGRNKEVVTEIISNTENSEGALSRFCYTDLLDDESLYKTINEI